MKKDTVKNTPDLNDELQHVLYVVSHDLGKYVRHMREFTNILLEESRNKFSEDELEYADMIIRAANNSESMIAALLEYSRVVTQSQPSKPVNCNKLVQEVLEGLQAQIKQKKAKITVLKLPIIFADENQIRTVFKHLITNALTFIEPDTIPVIKISSKTKGKMHIFSVKDNGMGIPEKFQEKTLKLFTRLNLEDKYPGIGAGLAIVKRIVNRHEGEVWFNPSPKEGTEIFFSIPKP